MKRGDLVTVVLQGDFGKPRPALVVQADHFSEHPTFAVLVLTSDLRNTPLFRVDVSPDTANNLRVPSQVMIDKIMTLRREKIGHSFGTLDAKALAEVERCLALCLGLAK